jgi:serine/threonine protein phosphatase PrpC
MHEPDRPGVSGSGDELPAAIDVFGATHPGKVRAANEDQFFIASLRKAMRVHQTSLEDLARFARLHSSVAYLLVVADGVGGLGGGKQASSSAVATLAEHIGETISCYYNLDVEKEHDFLAQLESAVTRAHERLREEHAGEGHAPATTLTMVALVWPRAYIVHVGDSRAYYLRGSRLRQITRDQTAFEEVVDQGTMSEEEARRAGLKNMLTSAIGASIKPSIGLIDLEPGDALLLCTDGLCKHVSDAEIAAVLDTGAGAEECCARLIERTLEGGAKDNVTVVVGRFAEH